MSRIPPADRQLLTPSEIAAEALGDWRYLASKLRTRFATRTFARGLALVDRIGAEAERVDHHPDLDLRYSYVDVMLMSHDVGGVTRRDIRLARTISQLAEQLDAPAQPDAFEASESSG
jgi:4a-hydroxytetrahydrobiopterin dehydratase